MKGSSLVEDIGWTLIVLVVFEILAVIALFLYVQIQIKTPFFSSTDPIAYSIDFLEIYNKPYMLTEVLANVKIKDRQMLEQAIEVSVANSLNGASAPNLPDDLAVFLNKYQFDDYQVLINRENREVSDIENAGRRCGDNLEGWCVLPSAGVGCDVGRVQIIQGDNICAPSRICCKEDIPAYKALNTGLDVVLCGSNRGVCSGTVINPSGDQGGPIYLCEDKREKIETNSCLGTNGGKTPVCCAPFLEKTPTQTTKGRVPLLYKQTFGTLEVTAK